METEDIKKLMSSIIGIDKDKAAQLMYYADAFPVDTIFVNVYFDEITLSPEPSVENPHVINFHCLYRPCPLDTAQMIAERMIGAGIHHTYLIPELCPEGYVLDESCN
jgi:hypothetical protein